ncbi:hypothetical protein WN72_05030 [Bradyrhizobium arachidis]|uniref:Uncharacterized protein n=1 Tax=Bradyrhizobium arachidis TaxID=858423 RepID=A0AAE7TFN1_9BRAD|nr:hypothetical protein WN72_05030 [Bradyrhizobium arachidis]
MFLAALRDTAGMAALFVRPTEENGHAKARRFLAVPFLDLGALFLDLLGVTLSRVMSEFFVSVDL